MVWCYHNIATIVFTFFEARFLMICAQSGLQAALLLLFFPPSSHRHFSAKLCSCGLMLSQALARFRSLAWVFFFILIYFLEINVLSFKLQTTAEQLQEILFWTGCSGTFLPSNLCLILLYMTVNPVRGKSVSSSHPVGSGSPFIGPLTYSDFVSQLGLTLWFAPSDKQLLHSRTAGGSNRAPPVGCSRGRQTTWEIVGLMRSTQAEDHGFWWIRTQDLLAMRQKC